MIFAILFLIAYSCAVFFINNIIVLGCLSAFDLMLCIIFRTGVARTFKSFLKTLIFVAFIFLINLIFYDALTCLVIAWRIEIVVVFVYAFSRIFTATQIANGISQLFFPLKIFRVDTEALSLVVAIAIAFLPILSRSIRALSQSLAARGFKFTPKNIATQGHLIFAVFFNELFRRMDSLELAFKARGYTEKRKTKERKKAPALVSPPKQK